MANATNVQIRDYYNGDGYQSWHSASEDSYDFQVGCNSSNTYNFVMCVKFTISSPADSVTISLKNNGSWNVGEVHPMRVNISAKADDPSYVNYKGTACDGTFYWASQYSVASVTIGKKLSVGTYYAYISAWYVGYGAYSEATNKSLAVSYAAAASYTLTKSQGAGTSLTTTLNSSPYRSSGGSLATNATIYAGETIKVTYSANTGYGSATGKYGSTTISSGGSFTVTGNVTVSSSASVLSYSLTITPAAGTKITVRRTSSPKAGATTGAISSGTTVYYDDVLSVSFSAETGYNAGSLKVNGSTVSSGSSHTVRANVAVTSTSTVKSFTLTISAGANSSITVYRSSSPKQNASTGNLSNNATIYYSDTLKVTFSASSGFGVNAHTVNGSTFTSGNTHTVTANVSVASTAKALASSIGATDANIGSTSTITVTKGDSSYYHSIAYSMAAGSGGVAKTGYVTSSGGTSSTAVRFSQTSVAFSVPSAFYDSIPNAKTGTCTLTCKTYTAASGGSQIGASQTTTFRVSVPSGAIPSVSGTIEDTNTVTYNLTGGNYLIRYKSSVKCTISASTAYSAGSISSKTVNGYSFGSGATVTFSGDNVTTGSYKFVATDSRGMSNSYNASKPLIEYTKLTLNITAKRKSPSENKILLSFDGNFFNGNFGAYSNALSIRYRYKETTATTYSDWIDIDPSAYSIGTNRYYTSSSIVLSDGDGDEDIFDYTKAYNIDVYASDGAGGNLLSGTERFAVVERGVPVFDWGKNDFKFNYSVGFGVTPQNEKSIEIANDWTVKKGGALSLGNIPYYEVSLEGPLGSAGWKKICTVSPKFSSAGTTVLVVLSSRYISPNSASTSFIVSTGYGRGTITLLSAVGSEQFDAARLIVGDDVSNGTIEVNNPTNQTYNNSPRVRIYPLSPIASIETYPFQTSGGGTVRDTIYFYGDKLVQWNPTTYESHTDITSKTLYKIQHSDGTMEYFGKIQATVSNQSTFGDMSVYRVNCAFTFDVPFVEQPVMFAHNTTVGNGGILGSININQNRLGYYEFCRPEGATLSSATFISMVHIIGRWK